MSRGAAISLSPCTASRRARDDHDDPGDRSRCTPPTAALADGAPAVSRAGAAGRTRRPQLPRLPGRAHGRGGRPPRPDPDPALRAAAHFPFLKTIEEFDFTFQTSVRLALLGSVLGRARHARPLPHRQRPQWHGENALGRRDRLPCHPEWVRRPLHHGDRVIDDLSVATRKGKLRHALPAYTHPHVLVIDEVGYLSYGGDSQHYLPRRCGRPSLGPVTVT